MQKNRNIVYFSGFIFAVPVALVAYINSSFIESFVGNNYTGLVYSAAAILTIIGMLIMPRLLTRFGNLRIVRNLGILTFLSLATLSFSRSSFLTVPVFMVYFASMNLVFANLDIFIEEFSTRKAIGKFRGLYLTILNSAWVISQFISGSIIEKSSFKGIYLFSSLFFLIFVSIFFLFLKDFKDPKYRKIAIKKTIKAFVANTNLSKIYAINFILRFFYSWMVIYTPIYLHEYVGIPWEQIGIIFAFMLLPFVFLSFPLGRWSDKIGEKEMLIVGFMVIALSTMVIPFIRESNLWIWALILFTTRIGAATIEVMSETYFFKLIHEEEADEIDLFRTTGPVAFIFAPIIATLTLVFVPSFQYLFFVLGIVLFFGLLVTLRIEDTA